VSWSRRRPAVATAALTIVLVTTVLLLRGSGTIEVIAVFERAHGLIPGGLVVSNGVPVGEVADIGIGDDGLPHVRLRVDDDLHLREGARADLRLRSNSGELNRVVALSRGEGAALGDGAVIPVARTESPVELDDVLGTLEPAMRNDVRAVLAGLDDATTGLQDEFRTGLRHSATALAESASLVQGVTRDGAALRQLVTSGRVAADTLATNRAGLGATVAELAGLLRMTAARDDELRATVQALPAGLRGPRLALDEVRAAIPALRALVRAADPVSRELGPTARELAPTLRAATPTLRALNGLLRDAPAGLAALRPLLRAARPLAERLTPTLTAAGPALDQLRVFTPELAGFLGGWSQAASTYDAAGHAVRLMPSQAPIPTTEREATSLDPGYLAAPFLRTPGALVRQPWTDYRSSFLSKGRGQ